MPVPASNIGKPNGVDANGMYPKANGDLNGAPNGSMSSESATNGNRRLEITIVGAGLGGVAAAISCSLAGHHVKVLEAAPKLAEVGAGIQLTPNVTRLLRRWGLFETLSPQAVQPGTIWLRRWENGKPISRTKLAPDFERDFGAPYWVVHRAHLHQALLDRALELGAEIHVDSRVTEMDVERGTVTTYTGTVHTSDLIVGCDGLKSITRSLFLGDKDAGPVPSPYCAYRSTVPMDILLADPELADIVERPDISLWIGPDRHVMTYPISGGKSFNMVLSHPYNGQTDGWPKDADAVLQEMKDNYAGWDPKLVKIINQIQSTAKWQLMAYPRLDSWRHPSGKFVMMGDAVHAMVPYMSQGAAQAIEDAAALGCCLARYGKSKFGDLVHLTSAFQEIRIERAYQVQYRSALNGRIWHFADGPAQRLRDEGMAETLTDEHYVRSANQWSDPSTQVWLYGYDVDAVADRFLNERFPTAEAQKQAIVSEEGNLREMVAAGLLAQDSLALC